MLASSSPESYCQKHLTNGVWNEEIGHYLSAASILLIFSRAPYSYGLNRLQILRAPFYMYSGLSDDPKTREDIGKLGAKGDIGFFIGYSADSCAYRVYNRRTKKIMETMNVTFDELSVMAFEQSNSKPGLQSMTSGQISSGLDLTYAPSTITTQKPTEGELDLLFEAMYDDYIGGQPSSAPRTALAAQAPQVLQTPTATTTTADTAPTPTNSSSQATNFSNTSQDVDELETQQHVQHQPATIADNVPNAMFDENTFVNPFATPSTNADNAGCKDTFKEYFPWKPNSRQSWLAGSSMKQDCNCAVYCGSRICALFRLVVPKSFGCGHSFNATMVHFIKISNLYCEFEISHSLSMQPGPTLQEQNTFAVR
ncbi:hypothetical protein Tco_1476101 [Tanacetum coccineum]